MTTATPTVKQCLIWMEQHDMLDNIRAHSFMVARVAEALFDGLLRTGKTTAHAEKDLVIAGALMHDIAKTLCIKTGCHHAKIGQDICTALGYPGLGEIVAEHVVLKYFTPDLYRSGIFAAKELVYYADKRVRHDNIVPLSSRLLYILERYGNGDPQKQAQIRANFNFTIEFEGYLFNYLDFPANDLEKKIKKREF